MKIANIAGARALADGKKVFRTNKLLVMGRSGLVMPLSICSDTIGGCVMAEDVARAVVDWINVGDFFKFRSNKMSDKVEQATATLDHSIETFTTSLNRFDAMQDAFADKCKRAAGSVRDAAEKLGQGMGRVEKAANFDRLERYVLLLERAATAMTMLAELEATGKLDKIASAMR